MPSQAYEVAHHVLRAMEPAPDIACHDAIVRTINHIRSSAHLQKQQTILKQGQRRPRITPGLLKSITEERHGTKSHSMCRAAQLNPGECRMLP